MTRLLLGVVTAVVLNLPIALRAEDGPKDILAKAIKAHGGEEFLTKHLAGKSKNKGKITLPGVGEVEFTQETAHMVPDKFRESMELDINGQKIKVLTVVNGDKISIEANGAEVPITDQIKSAIKGAQHLMKVSRMLAPFKEKGYELSAAGEIKVGENPAVGVRVSAKGEKDITMYFDKKTGLLAKVDHQAIDAMSGNEVPEERIVLEYEKNAAGIPIPKNVVVKRDGKNYLEAEVLETKQLEKLDDSEFAK